MTLNLHRGIISEYLANFAAADGVPSEKEIGLWLRITFNRALFIRDTNSYFRRLNTFARNPKNISDEIVRQFNQEVEEDYKGFFW